MEKRSENMPSVNPFSANGEWRADPKAKRNAYDAAQKLRTLGPYTGGGTVCATPSAERGEAATEDDYFQGNKIEKYKNLENI